MDATLAGATATPEGGDHRSTAAVAGHPLHPAVVPVPIGMLTAAAVSDVGYLVTGERFFARMSRWLVGGGIVGGLLAAPLGALDLSTIRAARTPTGLAHAGGNVAVLALSIISLAMRQRAGSRVPAPALVLTMLSAVMLAVTGWLGGELSYRKGIGVLPHDER